MCPKDPVRDPVNTVMVILNVPDAAVPEPAEVRVTTIEITWQDTFPEFLGPRASCPGLNVLAAATPEPATVPELSVLAGSSSKLLSEMNMPSLPKKLQPRLPRCFSQRWCPCLVNLSGPRESCWRHSGPRGPLVLDFIIIWFYNYNFIWLQKAALLPLEPVTLQAEFANGGTSQNWFLIDF